MSGKVMTREEAIRAIKGWDFLDEKEKEALHTLIPELKEESREERIRKAISYAIGQSTHEDGTLINGVTSEEAIKWIGGIIPTKFNTGDWIVHKKDCTIHQVKNVVRNVSDNTIAYDLTDGDYISSSGVKNYRLWNIQDSMTGDILVASDGSMFIYSGIMENNYACYFVALSRDNKLMIGDGKSGWEHFESCRPAIKEEQDYLFSEIKEETGCDWDGVKLRLFKDEEEKETKGIRHDEEVVEVEVENGTFLGYKPELRIKLGDEYKIGDKVKVVIKK